MPGAPRAVTIGCSLALLVCPLWARPGGDDLLLKRIDEFVEQERLASRIPGIAVAIVSGTRIAHVRGYGEDGNGHPITSATPFPIGSNTKSFTSLAAMGLVEAGKVDLDAPVQRYLPEFLVADTAASSRITVRHLLNQTSGLPHQAGLTPLYEEKVESLEQVVANMRDVKLNRSPGHSFEYSNLNAVVLGRIIERVSGDSWAHYVQCNLLAPLSMPNTYTSFEEAARHGMSGVHRYVFGFPLKTDPVFLPGMAPSGYLVSSATDMVRYLSYYLSPDSISPAPLSPDGIAAMLSPETNAIVGPNLTYRYGRGWAVGQFGVARDARWHSGALDSFNAWMVLLPETQQGVVVLINAGSYFPVHQAKGVFRRIPIGVVNILRSAPPPSGVTIKQFFAPFNTAVIVLILVQIAIIRRVAAKRRYSWKLCGLETGLGTTMLIGWPVVSGMGWQASIRALPDLAAIVMVVSMLFLMQAGTRLRYRSVRSSPGV